MESVPGLWVQLCWRSCIFVRPKELMMYTTLYQYLISHNELPVPGIGTFLLQRKPAINHFSVVKDPSVPRDLEFEDYLRKFMARKQFFYRSSTAIQAVMKKNWFTAKFHLPWLCEQEPNNPRWKKLLDEVNAASSIPDE